jgi:N-acetylglucosaminyl-diphospho-decaprenol L-rhamnosyltransferase
VKILVVIVNYRTAALVARCLQTLAGERTALPDLRAVVVDNPGGADDAQALRTAVAEQRFGDWVEVRAMPRNGGFSYGVNAGVQPAMTGPGAPDAFLLLNPDTYVRPGAVAELAAFLAARPDVGIVGSRLEDEDGTVQHSRFRFPGVLSSLDEGCQFGPVHRVLRRWAICPPIADDAHRVDWLSGACMLVRRETFARVGPFDEGFFLYFEELDFMRRAADLGVQSWQAPASRVVHLVGQSTGLTVRVGRPPRLPAYWFASRRRYFTKHHGRVRRFAIDAAFVVGRLFGEAVRIARRRPATSPPRLLGDFVRHMVGLRAGAGS